MRTGPETSEMKSAGSALWAGRARRQSAPAQYSRPDEATQDTTRRCYLRGPDGVTGPTPFGTWSIVKVHHATCRINRPAAHSRDRLSLNRRALQPPHSPQRIHLPHFPAQNENDRGVIHPDDHDDDRRQRASEQRPWVEVPEIHGKSHLRDLQQYPAEQRRQSRGLEPNPPRRQNL